MKTIKQIRKEYPQYDSISDEEIADRLYKKHYKDKISQEEFNEKIGLSSEKVDKNNSEAHNQLFEKGLGIPAFATAAKLASKSGYLNTANGVAQLLAKALGTDNKYFQKEVAKDASMQNQNINRAKAINPIGAFAGEMAGSIASTPFLPGVGGAAAKLVSGPLSKAALGTAVSGGAESALGTALQYTPEGQSRGGNALSSGIFGTLAGGLLPLGIGGAAKGYDALNPLNFLKTNLTQKQVGQNVEAARGTQTGLGQILENPQLSKFQENYLNELPFSGGAAARDNTADIVNERANNLYKEIAGDAAEDGEKSGVLLKKELKSLEKQLQQQKRSNYAEVEDIAAKNNVTIDRENLRKIAREKLKTIESSDELKSEISKKLITRLKRYAEEPIKSKSEAIMGKSYHQNNGLLIPTAIKVENKGKSLKNTNIFKGLLGEEASEAFQAGKDFEGGIYASLREGLMKDLNKSIDTSPKELKNAYSSAENYYKENIAPLSESTLMKYIRQDKDADTLIDAFVKQGSGKDRSILLEKLTGMLEKSPNYAKSMQALRKGIFSKSLADEQVNPMQFASIFNKFGPNQQKALFKDIPKTKKEIQKFSKLTHMNKEGLNAMFNPPNGAKAQALLPFKSAVGGFASGYALGGIPGAMVGSGLGLGLGPGQYLNKKLTNEVDREKLINKMFERQPRGDIFSPESLELMKQAIRGATVNASKEKPKEERKK